MLNIIVFIVRTLVSSVQNTHELVSVHTAGGRNRTSSRTEQNHITQLLINGRFHVVSMKHQQKKDADEQEPVLVLVLEAFDQPSAPCGSY